MILVRRLVVVYEGQLIHGGDEEVVVHSHVAVVMHNGSNVAGEQDERLGGLLEHWQHPSLRQHHVQRLQATLPLVKCGCS